MVVAGCSAVALLLSAWSVADLMLPLNLQVTPDLELRDIACAPLAFGETFLSYNASKVLMVLHEPSVLVCSVTVVANQTSVSALNIGLNISAGRVEIDTFANESSCLTTAATLASCGVTTDITSVSVTPNDPTINWLLNATMAVVDLFKTQICDAVAKDLIDLLVNHTAIPPATPPPFVPGNTPIEQAGLFELLVNVLNNLPELLGLSLKARYVTENTLEMDITFAQGIAIAPASSSSVSLIDQFVSQASRAAPMSFDGSKAAVVMERFLWFVKAAKEEQQSRASLVDLPRQHQQQQQQRLAHQAAGLMGGVANLLTLETLVIPAGTTLQLQLVANDLQCSSRLACSFPIANPVSLLNVRLTGDGDFDRIVDVLIGALVKDLLNVVIDAIAESSAASKNQTRVELALPTKAAGNVPSIGFIVPFGLLCVALAAAVVLFSARRHKNYPVYDSERKVVPITRVVLEDAFIASVCFSCIFLFAWSNSTKAAQVVLGGEINLFSFDLANTVRKLWDAGLQPLSFFVCLFSGVYPYFKLLTIVLYSVILQRPQSRLLRGIDSLGKFSLLDSFVMLIMVGGLEIKGVADVHVGASFYIFVTATVLSILVGNYATHGWRHATSGHSAFKRSIMSRVQSIDNALIADEQDLPKSKIFFFGTIADYFQPPASQPRNSGLESGNGESLQMRADTDLFSPASPAQVHTLVSVRKRVVIPATIAAITCVGIYGSQVLLTYNTGGLATVVVGTSKTVTLLDMVQPCGLYITGVSFFTLVLAPVLYCATFPGGRFLGAWCAMDAFLLACVSGLLQLEQFIKFVLGGTDASKVLYSATASLGWPLAMMCTLMSVCWCMLLADLLHVRCYRKESPTPQ